MKTKVIIALSFAVLFFLASCSKDNKTPQLTFTNNATEGLANTNGEYTITGTLVSDVNLQKVILTKEGQNDPFLVDDSQAKNKNTYDFSYLVTGINSNTYVIFDAYDQNGGKTTARFYIKK